jgi:hypothetical protein
MASNDSAKATTAGVPQSGISADVLLLGITDGGLFDVTASGLFDVTASGLFDVTASGLFDVASGLFGVTAVRDNFEGRALGKGGNGAGRWSALVRAVWCNQSKKDEGASCAWTDALHSNKDRDNVANTLNFIKRLARSDNGRSLRQSLTIRSNFA